MQHELSHFFDCKDYSQSDPTHSHPVTKCIMVYSYTDIFHWINALLEKTKAIFIPPGCIHDPTCYWCHEMDAFCCTPYFIQNIAYIYRVL